MTSKSFLCRRLAAICGALGLGVWMAGCTTPPTAPFRAPVPGQLSRALPDEAGAPHPIPPASQAANPREYRRDAAGLVYALNRGRIYTGKLPPMLYAVGTLQVELETNGRVRAMRWLRAPTHAPEVIAEIERTVLAASPFPAAPRIGKLAWTDTWLWDKGGHFQLDTLTEGQLQSED